MEAYVCVIFCRELENIQRFFSVSEFIYFHANPPTCSYSNWKEGRPGNKAAVWVSHAGHVHRSVKATQFTVHDGYGTNK